MTRHEPPEFRLLPDSDELEPSEDPGPEPAGFSRRTRLAAGVLAVALALAGGTFQLHRARQAAQLARTAHPVQTAPPAVTVDGQQAAETLQSWPHAATGVCGGRGSLLPILTSRPLAEPTGVRLVVGGFGIRTVDVDSGAVSASPQVALREGNLVLDRRTLGATSYLMVGSCGGSIRVLSYAAGRPARNLGNDIAATLLFGNSTDGVWMASFLPGTQTSAALQVELVRLDRPGRVLLPANSFPLAFSGHLVVGETISPSGMKPPELIVFDSARRRIVRDLGPASSFSQSRGVVIWTSQPCSAATSCQLHTFDVRTGRSTTRGYSLPVEAGVTGAVLSPDRGRLAFQLPRMSGDPRYSTDIPGTPSDLVVLNLGTGILEPVPNLELPPGSQVAMAFSPDSRWLVTAVTGQRGPQLLSWRSGLTTVLASSARLPGPVPDPVPLLGPAG
jgi:hypothetical protein